MKDPLSTEDPELDDAAKPMTEQRTIEQRLGEPMPMSPSDHREGPWVPLLDKDKETGEWLLVAFRAGLLRFPEADRALAAKAWEIAMWSYRNGADHAKRTMREALGVRDD